MKKSYLPALTLLSSLIFSVPSNAEPWVDTSNVFLRNSIQLLADNGIVTTPVTTFPLMWHDIANDINKAYVGGLSEELQHAYLYVRHQLNLAKKNSRIVSVNAANEKNRFTSFGDSFRDKNNISISHTFMTDRFAVKISPSYTTSSTDDDNIRYDGSYAAAFLGNWVLSLGKQDRWWGPGWDTSLSLTNNARPLPAVTLSRKSAQPFDIPFTDISIPWTVTSFMGVLDDDRFVDDALLWGFRANFKPTQNLEIGLTRLAQWGGEGRSQSLGTFWDVLKGLDNCGGNGPSVIECQNGEEPGNQLAGYDIRWSSNLFSQPFALYFTSFAEDGDRKGGLSILGEERYQYGIESQFSAFDHLWRVYLEGTDTYALCKDGNNGDGSSNIGDCYYEHHIYKTGMRYKGRSLGSLYENDASTYVLGFISQADTNTNIELKLRWLQLNKDNSDIAPENPQQGNTLTSIAENMVMVSAKVQHSYKKWRYTVGTNVSHSSFDNDIDDDNEINLYFNIEYNL